MVFTQTVRLKFESENKAEWELIWTIAEIVLLAETNSPVESHGWNQNYALILRGARWNEYT